ncbi:glycoside hydrolase family 13 protein [Paramicrobacterium agarici]|uniref:glycoside hydrolase family 13 protein n=1 Tax=Paramicrobacterium agarici TaxID=630514 RepID=UPI00114F550A|nr:glycoside hydrolase family 13 protein [Microbacterium agarici]TQO22176.1 alpha-glucosidase [Microbacterium agarici]
MTHATAPSPDAPLEASATIDGAEWWRSAVIYQIYPRSFADANGDGMGDLAGITSRLDALKQLGIDAIWLSPFFASPQKDAGYDVSDYCAVDPLFGTLEDFDTMTDAAHARGIRVIVDLVPNHSSDQHEWFQEALAAAPGSPERARYIFRDGRGEHGEEAPNNWDSVFGGPAWTRTANADGSPDQWYLHLFDSSQPDFDWSNADVRRMFRDVLRFWLDRGVDGFRVDVAHGLVKADGLPDFTPPVGAGSMGGQAADEEPVTAPYWGQEGVHEIYREWNQVLAEYDGQRVLCAEAWVDPLEKMALWVRSDEMQQAFNFPYLETPWNGPALRTIIDESLAAFSSVGAPSTWVLSNHDVVRHASRLALTAENPQGHGIGPETGDRPDRELGLRRARAASALMLALPGGAYIYQGEELGLPEAIDLPDEARQDPTWFRTSGERYGRDGCRVPIPWEADAPAYGFSETGASWLPQPEDWGPYARASQSGDADSTLELYSRALWLRSTHQLGLGAIEWHDAGDDSILWFSNGPITVVANTGVTDAVVPTPLRDATRILASSPHDEGTLPADTTAWFLTP